MQGTISFGLGFFFVIIGWPIFGMILEAYGFVVLFRFVGYRWPFARIWICMYISFYSLAMLNVDKLCCAVASGQHWQSFFRKFLFLDGYFSNHMSDRLVCAF